MWKPNYRREKRRRVFSPVMPFGSLVVPQQSPMTGTALASIPPFTHDSMNFIGDSVVGVAFSTGAPAPSIFYGTSGAVPITPSPRPNTYGDPGDGIWGLQRPIVRHAVQRGHVWAPSIGANSGSSNRHLIRLSNTTGTVLRFSAAAIGTAALATPAVAIVANKVIYAQEGLNSVVSWTINSDGTAAFDGDIALPFGVSPDGVGAAVLAPSGTKALVFGKNLENRNQICQTTDGAAYAALPALPISAGAPLRVVDAIALPASGAGPAAILVAAILGSASGPPRVLRSIDDGASFSLLAIDSAAVSASGGALHYVNGVVFLLFGATWFYSLDHGASFVKGNPSIAPQRVQWDADLRCYIAHCAGSVAILDDDLGVIGAVPLPVGDGLLSQLPTAAQSVPLYMSGVNSTAYPTANGLLYESGYLLGLAVSMGPAPGNIHYGRIAYRYDLQMLRLPKLEAAEVTLVGGGAAGEMYDYQGTPFPAARWPLANTQRSPASASYVLGLSAASGGMEGTVTGFGAEVKFCENIAPVDRIFPVITAAGALGVRFSDGVTVGGGGDAIHDRFHASAFGGTISGRMIIVGGASGEVRTVKTNPGQLLVIIVGVGGRVMLSTATTGGVLTSSPFLKAPVSIGQDGGIAVEYWENLK